MPGITFSQEDIVAAAEITAGWYPVIAKQIVEGVGKNDPSSTTWSCVFVVQEGDYKGMEILYWFSSKMMKNAVRYLRCFGVQAKAGEVYPIEETVGRPVQAYCIVKDGNNTITDFKPIGR